MEYENSKYPTFDFYQSAYLLALGFKLVKIDHTNPQRAVFIFEQSEDIPTHIEDFNYGRGAIEPMLFVGAIKQLKNLLYANR